MQKRGQASSHHQWMLLPAQIKTEDIHTSPEGTPGEFTQEPALWSVGQKSLSLLSIFGIFHDDRACTSFGRRRIGL